MTDALKVYGPLAAILLILLVITMRFIAPPPPMELRFAAGGVDGQYYQLAQQYAAALDEHGIEVEVLETAGTVENYALLKSGDADVALLQGGIASGADREAVQSLGGVLAEPFWIFVRASSAAQDFGDLSSVTIAAGPDGSGTRAMTERLQREWGGDWSDLSPLSGSAAAAALMNGQVDAAVFTAAVDASYVRQLPNRSSIRLIGVRRANGLAMRDAALAPVTLFEGVVNMDRNIPSVDTSLIAAIAQLGVRADLHPALQALRAQMRLCRRCHIRQIHPLRIEVLVLGQSRRQKRPGPAAHVQKPRHALERHSAKGVSRLQHLTARHEVGEPLRRLRRHPQ